MTSCLALGVLPAALAAQAVPPRAEPPAERSSAPDREPVDADPDIVVTGQRQRGAVIGDIPPDQQLGPAEIRSYGVSSLAELLDELAPQTTSGRGRGGDAPVVLLNGHRISGLSEIRDIPVEAISRVDILPEEVALKYGYRADSRVVNIVLRPRFRAVTGELAGRTSTGGGGDNPTADATLLRINKNGRFNLALNYQHSDPLLDSQRDITETQPRRPYDLTGNVAAAAGNAEIDPALSALAGQPVAVAGVPVSATTGAPALGAFAATANQPNTTDLSPYRTLLPETQQASINAVLNRNFGKVGATVNGRFQYNDSDARLGLASAALDLPQGNPFSPFGNDVAVDRYLDPGEPLRQRTRATAAHLGFTFDGDLARWRWSLTSAFDRNESRTLTDRGFDIGALQTALTGGDPTLNPFGPIDPARLGMRLSDRAHSVATSGNADLLLSGPLFDLPAGPVSTSVRAGFAASGFDSDSVRAGLAQSGRVNRTTGNGQVNLDIPLTSRRKGVLGAIGDLSINANLALDHLSDFGTLTTIGYGLHWMPVTAISLVVSATDEDGAPTPQQIGNPMLFTPQTPVFDYRTGSTVDVTRIDGGNRALTADNRHVVKVGLTLKPWPKIDLSLTANYVRSATRNAILAFPSGSVTPEIEAAFADRFVRDANGDLTQIDARPVNIAREDRKELRWGINFSKPLKSAAQDRFAALRAAGAGLPRPPGGERGDGRPGGGGGPGGGGRGFGGGGFGGGGGRLQFAIYHTWHIRDDILIRDGIPVLDLLHGSAIGSSGGQARHEIEAQAGFTRNGIGARLSANWHSGTTVDGIADRPTSNLVFSDLATLNLRLFTDLGQVPGLARKHPWLRGARVTFAVENLFDARTKVVDGTGAVPIRYEPDRLDPLGRTVRLTVRKLFF
ncbi:TonB-dependent receptor [Sphingosinicellaceae bacterium]|nr:TonB-dependent receptor [Sphingosinicellaceae bacterium]